MVRNADGIKLTGVTLSICSEWDSCLAMIQLLRCSCAPASRDASNCVCAEPFERTAPIGHVETDRSIGRSHRPTCQGPEESRERFAEPTARRSSTHPFRSSPECETFRYSLQDRSGCLYSSLLSFRGGQTRRPNFG